MNKYLIKNGLKILIWKGKEASRFPSSANRVIVPKKEYLGEKKLTP